MKLLFLADVVGEVGRTAVLSHLPSLKQQFQPDLILVNGENSAHGKGITQKIYDTLIHAGVDVITMGNHAFSKHEIEKTIHECTRMVRPANLDCGNYGQEFLVTECCGLKIGVVNLSGSIFMDRVKESPYEKMEAILEKLECDCIFVDFHAEATSEKRIFFELYKHQCIAVVGTHTHIQTADEMVEDGCAFISDAGMCGAYHSILGRDIDEVIRRNVHHEKTHYTPASGDAIVCGVIIEVDEQTRRAVSIERIQLRPDKLALANK